MEWEKCIIQFRQYYDLITLYDEKSCEELCEEYKKGNKNVLVGILKKLHEDLVKIINSKVAYDSIKGDMYASCIPGIINSIELFDASRGNKFLTYCKPKVMGCINDTISKNSNMLKLPKEEKRKIRLIKKFIENYPQEDTILLAEIINESSEIKVTPDDIKRIKDNHYYLVNLDKPVGDYSEDTFGDTIIDKDFSLEEIFEKYEQRQTLQKNLSKLDEQSKRILKMRYIEQMSYESIGKIENLSYSKIKAIETDALIYLRKTWMQ